MLQEKDSILHGSHTGSSKMTGMAELAIKVGWVLALCAIVLTSVAFAQTNDDALSSLRGVGAGKTSAAVLYLDPSSEQLSKGTAGNLDIAGIQKLLPVSSLACRIPVTDFFRTGDRIASRALC